MNNKIDLSKITGPYSLLGLFLIVIEGLLSAWLFLAQSAFERCFSGLLMTILLLGFLYVFYRMRKNPVSTTVQSEGLPGNVSPATKEATETEVEHPEPDMMAGPDRSFLIARPPDDWEIREFTMEEWFAGNLGISNPAVQKKIFGDGHNERNVLALIAPVKIFIEPIPGESLINGRNTLTALRFEIPTRVAILPMERAQPPLFIEHSLEHNFHAILSQIILQGLVTLRNIELGTIPGSELKYIYAEFHQELSKVKINDSFEEKLSSNIIFIGIAGELRDHLLIINYPLLQNYTNSSFEQQLSILQELVNSFRPLRSANPEAEYEKIREQADVMFNQLFQERGEEFFFNEFNILMLRFVGKDLSNSEERNDVIRQLQPFEKAAKALGLHKIELISLWVLMHQAEKGDATQFIKKINEMIKEIK